MCILMKSTSCKQLLNIYIYIVKLISSVQYFIRKYDKYSEINSRTQTEPRVE